MTRACGCLAGSLPCGCFTNLDSLSPAIQATDEETAKARKDLRASKSALVVMTSNNTGHVVRSLAERFPGRLAHLISPGGWRRPFLPYALDNGAFGAYTRGLPFDEATFRAFLRAVERFWMEKHFDDDAAPLWLTVPDVVADASATIAAWRSWEPLLRPIGWPLGFVVQDGMTAADVPADADVIFVGG